MSVKPQDDGTWLVDCRPNGRTGTRIRKVFKKQHNAVIYERRIMGDGAYGKEFPGNADKRRLSDLVDIWYESHGKSLKDGDARYKKLQDIATRLGNPRALKFTTRNFTRYRATRGDDVGANTLNHELAYLRAVFNELTRLGEWSQPNPLAGIRKIQHDDSVLTYLTSEQIKLLLKELAASRSPAVLLVTKICLATGARWSEAQTLTRAQIQNGRITYNKTKNRQSRTIMISSSLEREALAGLPFTNCYSTFQLAITRVGIDLPPGQLTHVLRHTFASHFMMNGGNIIDLQRLLGHKTITMTMRYAHFSPDHLNDVLVKNPLAATFDDDEEKEPRDKPELISNGA